MIYLTFAILQYLHQNASASGLMERPSSGQMHLHKLTDCMTTAKLQKIREYSFSRHICYISQQLRPHFSNIRLKDATSFDKQGLSITNHDKAILLQACQALPDFGVSVDICNGLAAEHTDTEHRKDS